MEKRKKMWTSLFASAVLAVFASGCQTWFPEAGLTLPSPSYLEHPPQYIPRGPDFPLPKELNSQEKAAQQYLLRPGR